MDEIIAVLHADLQQHRRRQRSAVPVFSPVSTQEFAGLGGDAKWLKTTAKATYYQTLSEEMNMVGTAVGGGGHIHALNGSDLAADCQWHSRR